MAKEIIKENVVEAPTLFVGVGGTGSRIVTKVAEMCKPGEIENINFVCLDTNVNDLQNSSKSFAQHMYTIQTSNTQTVGSYLDYDQDALKNWFPKNAVLYDKTVSEGAGQVRAISRLALNSTIKTGKIAPLHNAIDDLFKKNGKEMKQAMRCVIASTASGGTGSGIILPLSMYIRDYVKKRYPNTSLIVRSLILLPETLDSVIDSNAERDSQRRNAYATIKELNAFMMLGSGFLNTKDSPLERYKNLHVDVATPGSDELHSLANLPMDFCFLVDGQNAEDNTLISFAQYQEQAALSLYEQNIGPMQKAAFSVEDNIIKLMGEPGNFGRNRFGGIGSGRIIYPYEDIADYIAFQWARDAIGGSNSEDGEVDTSKWSRYDKAYEQKHREEEKRGLPETEMSSHADVYTDKMLHGEDNFSIELRTKFLQDDTRKVNNYIKNLMDHMHESVVRNANISGAMKAANKLSEEIDYKDEANRGQAGDNLNYLRAFQNAVNANAEKTANSVAEALFYNEKKTINEDRAYSVEGLIKNAAGDIAHPNAVRYLLYKVEREFDRRLKQADNAFNNAMDTLDTYSPGNSDKTFNVAYTRKKEESSIDELCAAEKGEGDSASILEKLGGYEKIYSQLNQYFPEYYTAIRSLCDAISDKATFKIGLAYIRSLSKEFERFYVTFQDKVYALSRKQSDLADSLAFTKGSSIYYVCSSKSMLKELCLTTTSDGANSALLDSEANGKIFDAVKSNVRFAKEVQNADFVEEDKHLDIFDDVLLEYFKESVRKDCKTIDMNVIEAIAYENRLNAHIRARETMGAGGEKETIFENVSREQNERHILEVIALGERLSAPNIQRVVNEEPREIRLCAYNKSLLSMRNYNMKNLLPKGEAVDTVSRYELHFFNALYNITPNKLKKFAPESVTETGLKEAGLYHVAYEKYTKDIGPDSRRSMKVSTHIDKRWDSISTMPEIDFDFQEKHIRKIQKAFIRGLVFNLLKNVDYSASRNNAKKVFKYENTDERLEDLIVSNGTLCDEFYEILDALYINGGVVENIELAVKKLHDKDDTQKKEFEKTAFAFDLTNEFKLMENANARSSIFEIPIAYANSLPSSQRYASEIYSLVDAIVDVLSEEIGRCESEGDARFVLCDWLLEQFDLMIENYKVSPKLNKGLDTEKNSVIDCIYRKIRKVMEVAPSPEDFEEVIMRMRKTIRETKVSE